MELQCLVLRGWPLPKRRHYHHYHYGGPEVGSTSGAGGPLWSFTSERPAAGFLFHNGTDLGFNKNYILEQCPTKHLSKSSNTVWQAAGISPQI